MYRKSILFISFLLVVILLSACKPTADMPNPASVYCEENDGTLEIRTDAETGGQVGYCIFPDGSECEEWAYYRDECKPGDSLKNVANMPNPASVYCEENGGTVEIRTDEATGGQVGICTF
jgi:putative hemolysin